MGAVAMHSESRSTRPATFLGVVLQAQYANLTADFYVAVTPTPVADPQWIIVNHRLAEELGLNQAALLDSATLAILAGNQVVPNSQPIAQAYAGHQFGYFNPQLGDGRAILLGEIQSPQQHTYDIHLKGAGPTPFSRNGDGRSAIGPVVREFLLSEAMHALGIPTSRSLAAVASGENVMRQGVVPGAILTRIASSHIRVGTFEYFRARGKHEAIKTLADLVIDRHYPELRRSATPYTDLLQAYAVKQAHLISQWMLVGFIHGVMNTDNTAVSGETLDFGPCAFLDEYHPQKVFSSIDSGGRYAYGNQPDIAMWNLTRFGETLAVLLKDESPSPDQSIQSALTAFQDTFNQHWSMGLAQKIGLTSLGDGDGDGELIERLLVLMSADEADFTLSFRNLAAALAPAEQTADAFLDLFPTQAPAAKQWLNDWKLRVVQQERNATAIQSAMNEVNPLYIPRNHLVEEVILEAQRGEYGGVVKMHELLQSPYREQPGKSRFARAPLVHERVSQTFCGT